jgi:sec-independent protein translocase protein TatC
MAEDRTPPVDQDADAGTGPPGDRPMSLREHLEELRRRTVRALVWVALATALAFWFQEELVQVAVEPYLPAFEKVDGSLQVIDVGELFFVALKLALVFGLFLGGPFAMLEVWGFVAAGLYPRERRWVRVFAPVSMALFVCGVLFYYFVVQPVALDFLLTYNTDIGTLTGGKLPLEVKPTLHNAVSLLLTMALVMGLIFELPLVMLFAQTIGVVSWKTYSKYRRHFIMAALVIAAILTPTPDAFTLSLTMVPVLVLFEGGILLCRFVAGRRPPESVEESA